MSSQDSEAPTQVLPPLREKPRWRRHIALLAAVAGTLALTLGAMVALTQPAAGVPVATDALRAVQAPAYAQAPAVDKSPSTRALHAEWAAAQLAAAEHAAHLSHLSHLRLLAARRAAALEAARQARAAAAAAAYARAHPARIVTPHSSAPSGSSSSGGTSAPPASGGSGGCYDPSGQLTASQVGMVWQCAGGPAWATSSAVSVARCESGWNTHAYNPSGATGLWQILGSVVGGNLYDAHVNALNAVSKFTASGSSWAQWVCKPSGAAIVTTGLIVSAPDVIVAAPAGVHVTTAPRRATISWSAVTGAAVYEVRISGHAFYDHVTSARTLAVTLAPGSYMLNIRGGSSWNDVHGHWSATRFFTVPAPLPACSLECRAMHEALTRIGAPYVWGAAGPWAFDCSGLVVWSYAQLGVYEPHFTGDLWVRGYHVSSSALQPGDLVFFYSGHSHVGIYIGGGKMVDAPHTGTDVQVQDVDWASYSGAVRL